MRRFLRIVRRAFLALSLVALALLLFWILVLPGIVEGRIRAALADAGLPDATLRVRSLSLGGAEVVGLSLGPGERATADSIYVEYDVGELLSGHFDAITVTGPTVELRVRDGEIDAGPFADLRGGGGEPATALPFDRLVVRHGRLVLDLEGTRYVLPIDGVVRPAAAGAVGLSLSTRFGLRAVEVAGTVELAAKTGRADLVFTGPDGERVVLDAEAKGSVADGDFDVEFEGGAGTIDRIVAGHRVRLDGATLRGRASVRGFRRLTEAELVLDVTAPALDALALEGFILTVTPHRDGLSVVAEAEGGFGGASATATLPPLSLDRESIEVPIALNSHGFLRGRLLDAVRGRGVDVTGGFASAVAKGKLALSADGWSVDVDEARLEVRSGRVVHARSGAGASELSAHLALAARASPDLVEIAVRTVKPLALSPSFPGVIAGGTGTVSLAAGEPVRVRFGPAAGGWSVDGPDLEVRLEDVTAESAGFAAAGVSGKIRGRARLDGSGVRIDLDEGGRLRADGVFSDYGDLSRAEIRLPEAATLTADGGGLAFRSRLEVGLAAGAAMTLGEARVEDLVASLDLGATIEKGDLWIRVGPRSSLRASSVSAAGWDAAPVALRPGDGDAAPVVRIGLFGARDTESTGRLETAEGFRAKGPEGSAKVLSLAVAGSARTGSEGLVAAAGGVEIAAEEVRVSSAEVAVGRLTATVPLGTGREEVLPGSARISREGSVAVEGLRWRGDDLPPFAIALAREGEEMSFRATWPITDVATLTAEGRLGLKRGRPVGRARVDVPRFALHEGGRIATALETATGYSVTGEMNLAGTVDFEGSRITPSLEIGVFDVTATGEDGKNSIEGLGAKIRVDGFSPLSTAGGQLLSFDTAKLGDLAVQDGRIRFTVESPRSILLERAEWRLGSTGRFWVYSFRLDPKDPDVEIELFTEHLSLDEWLGLVTADHASGEGQLFGRLRVHVKTEPRLDVTVRSGFLHAEGSGKIRIHDSDRVRDVLAGNMPRVAGETDYSQVVQDRIVKALEDFGFSTLKFDIFENEGGGMTLRASVQGKGVEPPHQELDLTVNVNGFEELIDPALSLKLGIDRTKSGLLDRLRLGK